MGLFNSIMLTCPHCAQEVEEQSKSGSCSLSCYPLEEAEVDDVMAISNFPIKCDNCSGLFIVKTEVKVSSKIEKYVPEDDDDN